jgi:hypothetical protein
MTDNIKVIGDPLRPLPHWKKEPVTVTSAIVNADGKLPEPKPEGDRVIGDPLRPKASWQKEPTRMVPGNGRADD